MYTFAIQVASAIFDVHCCSRRKSQEHHLRQLTTTTTTMPVEVIGKDLRAVMFATCCHCSARLRYAMVDVQSDDDKVSFIRCPTCRARVAVPPNAPKFDQSSPPPTGAIILAAPVSPTE